MRSLGKITVAATMAIALGLGTLGVAASAGQRTVALGVSMWPGRSLAELDSFTTSIGGRTPATWSIWSQWGASPTREFPTGVAKGVKERGATPIIWWEPVDPANLGSPTFARLANVVAGDHDAYIHRFARDAKAFKSPVILRFAHEGNGRFFPWGIGSFDNDAATYVAAWRHVRGIFRDVGAKNVRFLWSVSKQGCDGGCNAYLPFYPGDAYVDYMGFSSFNWAGDRDEWVPMARGFRQITNKLMEVSAKPIVAIETASNAEGGDKAAWITNGYPGVYTEFPRIVAIVYLNVDLRPNDPDWRLSSPAAALQAYATIAARPEFRGKLPG